MTALNVAKASIKIRNDTAANWSAKNPLLEKGELAAEIDTNKLKIGNGTDLYNDLSYVNASATEIEEELNNKLSLDGGTMTGALVLDYVPTAANDAVNKGYVDNLIASAGSLKREIVEELPSIATADANTIYMVKDNNAFGPDKYREYMFFSGEFVLIGDTSVDLTNYVEKNELSPVAISGKFSDLEQDEDDVVVFDCGTSTDVIS